MTENKTESAVRNAFSGNANAFKDDVHDILADKVQGAIGIKRIDVSASFMDETEFEADDE